jgi:hypothetical protein
MDPITGNPDTFPPDILPPPPVAPGHVRVLHRTPTGAESVRDVPVVKVTSFADLKTLTEKTFPCQLLLDGQMLELEVRRLSAREKAEIDRVFNFSEPDGVLASREVIPPATKDEKGKPGYDFQNPKYLADLQEAKAKARALVLYHGCATIRSGAPDLKTPAEIRDHVANLPLGETALDTILWTILGGGLRTFELLNFTSPPASTNG